MNYRVIGQQKVNRNKGLLVDEEIILEGQITQQKYPEKLRIITYYDDEHDKIYQFLTNNFYCFLSRE